VLVSGSQHVVRPHPSVTHRLREQIPLGLRHGKKQVCAGEQRMFAPAQLLDRAVHHPLCGLSEFAHRNIEIIDVHGTLLLSTTRHQTALTSATAVSGCPAAWSESRRTARHSVPEARS